MAHRLDAVAVGVAQECAIVRRVIVARTRRAVVGAAGGDACVPECIDLGLPARLEAPVAAVRLFGLRPLADGEIDAVRIGGACPLAVPQPVVSAPDLDHAKRLHDGIVEPLGGGDVGDGYGDVVEHSDVLLLVIRQARLSADSSSRLAALAPQDDGSIARPTPRSSSAPVPRQAWP